MIMNELNNNKPAKTLLDEWRERQYVAFVNFLRKKSESMYEDWKKFKLNKSKFKKSISQASQSINNDENRLMQEFLILKEKEQHVRQNLAEPVQL